MSECLNFHELRPIDPKIGDTFMDGQFNLLIWDGEEWVNMDKWAKTFDEELGEF